MNFEKWMKKRGKNKLNTYAKNPYHVSWIKRVPLWGKIAVPAALAMTAAVVIVSVGVLPNLMANGGKNDMSRSPMSNAEQQRSSQTSQDGKGVSRSTPASTIEPGNPVTDLEKTREKFPTITYDSLSYVLTNNYGGMMVPYKYLGDSLTNEKMADINHVQEDVSIYSIKNIDKEVAVAFKSRYSNYCFAYYNLAAHFHDIEDFENLLSPRSEMRITYLRHVDYTGKDFANASIDVYKNYQNTNIYDIWFEDQELAGYTADDYDYESSTVYYEMNLEVDALGVNNFKAYFFNSGYIVFQMFDQNHLFNLGEARYQEFATYLANYKVS